MTEPVPRGGPEEPKNTPSLPPVVPKKFTALHAASIAALALLFSIDMKPKAANAPEGKKSPIVLVSRSPVETEEAASVDLNSCDPVDASAGNIPAAAPATPEQTVEELLNGPLEAFVASVEELGWSDAGSLTSELWKLRDALELRNTEFPKPEELAHLLEGKSDAMRASAHDIAIAMLTNRLEDVSNASRAKISAMHAETGMFQFQRKAALKMVSGIVPTEKSKYFDPKEGEVKRVLLYVTIDTFLQKQQQKGLLKPEQVLRIETWKKKRFAELQAASKPNLTANN